MAATIKQSEEKDAKTEIVLVNKDLESLLFLN